MIHAELAPRAAHAERAAAVLASLHGGQAWTHQWRRSQGGSGLPRGTRDEQPRGCNAGGQLSQGDWIYFRPLKRFSGIVLSSFGRLFCNPQQRRLCPSFSPPPVGSARVFMGGHLQCPHPAHSRNIGAVPCAVIAHTLASVVATAVRCGSRVDHECTEPDLLRNACTGFMISKPGS